MVLLVFGGFPFGCRRGGTCFWLARRSRRESPSYGLQYPLLFGRYWSELSCGDTRTIAGAAFFGVFGNRWHVALWGSARGRGVAQRDAANAGWANRRRC